MKMATYRRRGKRRPEEKLEEKPGFSSSLKRPAETKGATPDVPPAVLPHTFPHTYTDYLETCTFDTVLEILQSRHRYYSLSYEQKQLLLDRVGWVADDVVRWQAGKEVPIRVSAPITWKEWDALYGRNAVRYGGKTGPGAPEAPPS
jgi:hypothetical protein